MKSYLEHIVGPNDLVSFAAAFTFALIGIFLSLLLHARNRNKQSKSTPITFSWGFLLKDNLQRMATSLLLTFVGLRFSNELLGMEFTMWTALIVGFLLDKVAQALKNLSLKQRISSDAGN